jgi:hypothetical protein
MMTSIMQNIKVCLPEIRRQTLSFELLAVLQMDIEQPARAGSKV